MYNDLKTNIVQIEIDNGSGFCFGVTTAIKKAEEELAKGGKLYCLGDIVHNGSSPFSGTKEVSRRKNAALILSFGIFSFASRRKKSTPPHHSIIFSIGNTNIPSAPNAFSFPIISQKRFSSSTVCTEHQPS